MGNVPPVPSSLADVASLSDCILCDILFPAPPVGLASELESRRNTGFSYTSLTLSADSEAAPERVYSHLAKVRHELSRLRDQIILADSAADIRSAKNTGKLAIGFHFQGTEPIGRNLANVGAYYRLGVRWMLMAYNFQNNVGTGCIEAQEHDLGISQFGKDLIAEMNRVGMLVDCSHSGYRTTMDAMSLSTQPCIFSHSNPRALYDHPRNIWDDQIKMCAQTGGIIGINGVGPFIGEPREVTVDTIVRHIDYVVELVGPEHVALGLDYMTPLHCQVLYDFYNGDVAKVGLPAERPWGFFSPAQVPMLLNKLLARGYPREAVRGIMGENFLRIAEQVWQ